MQANSKILLSKKRQLVNNTTRRKINPEFTIAIRAAKAIRVCAQLMAPDRSRFHRLTKFILHHVIQQDTTHQPGERQLLMQQLPALKNYEFSHDHEVSRYIEGDIQLSIKEQVIIAIHPHQVNWPAYARYCKITLLGVEMDIASLHTATTSGSTAWLSRDDTAMSPLCIAVENNHPLFIAIAITFTDDTMTANTCQAVKIIGVYV